MSELSTETLAARINEEHVNVTRSFCDAVQHAARAGELLCEAKARVPYGKWLVWLNENCKFSERTARGYMTVAEKFPKLASEDRQRVAVLPLRTVLAELAEHNTASRKEPHATEAELVADLELASARIEGLCTAYAPILEKLRGVVDGFADATRADRGLEAEMAECLSVIHVARRIKNEITEAFIRGQIAFGRVLNWCQGSEVPSGIADAIEHVAESIEVTP